MLRVSIEPRHRNVLYFEFVMQSHYTSFAVATDKNIPCGPGKLYRQIRSRVRAISSISSVIYVPSLWTQWHKLKIIVIM